MKWLPAPQARYSQELKRQAVNMAIEDGFGVSETAQAVYSHVNIGQLGCAVWAGQAGIRGETWYERTGRGTGPPKERECSVAHGA